MVQLDFCRKHDSKMIRFLTALKIDLISKICVLRGKEWIREYNNANFRQNESVNDCNISIYLLDGE